MTIDELKTLRDGMTPGRWEFVEDQYFEEVRVVSDDEYSETICCNEEYCATGVTVGNQKAIAALPDIIDHVIALHEVNASLKAAHDERLAECERLREALVWYEENVSLCNGFSREHATARDRLAKDVGSKARAALAGGDDND